MSKLFPSRSTSSEGPQEDRGLTGPPARDARLRPRERLRSGADYRRVLRRGFRVDGPLLSLVACDNDLGYDRLGLAASRKLGGAVAPMHDVAPWTAPRRP